MKSRIAGSLPSARIGVADYRPAAQWQRRPAFSTASYFMIWELFGLQKVSCSTLQRGGLTPH
jgi:hypothetical protein